MGSQRKWLFCREILVSNDRKQCKPSLFYDKRVFELWFRFEVNLKEQSINQ